MNAKVVYIYQPDATRHQTRPLFLSAVPAGFPSPADDYLDRDLDLNEYFIQHPAATFYVRVSGYSMQQAGIQDGDILVVDRSLEARDGNIVVAVLDGELTVKRLKRQNGCVYLVPDNPAFPVLEIQPEREFVIWGVVTGVARKLDV